MKEDFNIEELFQEHFKSFESDVAPEAWSNIQQSVQAGTGTGSGMSIWVKGLLIGTGISAAVVGGIYFSTDDQSQETSNNDLVELSTEESADVMESVFIAEKSHNNEVSADDAVLANDEIENQEVIESDDVQETDQVNVVDNDANANGTSIDRGDASIDAGNDNGIATNDNTVDDHDGSDSEGAINQQMDQDKNDDQKEDLTISVKPIGILSFEKGSNANYTRYDFSSNADHHVSVSWNFGDGKTAEADNITHTYQQPGDYVVTMTVNGKEGVFVETAELNIVAPSNIGVIPNIFSPNNDGNNDLFVIQTTEIKEFVLIIQDQNGQTVFDTTDPNFQWDGTNKANIPVPSGNYNIIIKAVGTDGKNFIEGGVLRVIIE